MADAKVDDLQGIITIASVVARVTETKEELSDEAKVLWWPTQQASRSPQPYKFADQRPIQ